MTQPEQGEVGLDPCPFCGETLIDIKEVPCEEPYSAPPESGQWYGMAGVCSLCKSVGPAAVSLTNCNKYRDMSEGGEADEIRRAATAWNARAGGSETALRKRIAVLEGVLRERDGGSHDVDCKFRRNRDGRSGYLCNCGHDEVTRLLNLESRT